MNTQLIETSTEDLTRNMLQVLEDTSIATTDHQLFLQENSKNLQMIQEKTWIWRTPMQQRSIISDDYFPTQQGKMAQVMLETKVHFEQAILLSKDYAMCKLEIEELLLDMEESQQRQEGETMDSVAYRREDIKQRKLQLEMQAKSYSLQQYQIQFEYRMKEIQGWKNLQDEVYEDLKEQGLEDEDIFNKSHGEIENAFFSFLTNLKGIEKTTDGAEYNNLIALARFAVDEAIKNGMFEGLVERCNADQLRALEFLNYIRIKPNENVRPLRTKLQQQA